MMDLRRANLPTFNPQKQKMQTVAKQQRLIVNPQPLGGSTESRMSKLQESISTYFDSIQTVCRAGLKLAESLSGLMSESASSHIADHMKTQFASMEKFWNEIREESKSDLAKILMELTVPMGSEMTEKACRTRKNKNVKILEKCIACLASLHNSIFKTQLDIPEPVKEIPELEPDLSKVGLSPISQSDPNNNNNSSSDPMTFDLDSEWLKLRDVGKSVKSWFAMKESFSMLRKFVGLSEPEIRNLTKTSSDSLMRKLNQRIDSALKNYDLGLRTLPSDPMVVLGGLHIAQDRARVALRYCCSQMEVEQEIQRLPVSQFLHCELPLMPVIANNINVKADPTNSTNNINMKKNYVSQLIQTCNPKLTLSDTNELSSEILGEICPARWRAHVKGILQLLYGNSGLVVLDTISSSERQSAMISSRGSYVIILVPSEWCIKEDPGAMSLLKRDLDPEKQLGVIHVKYAAVYNTTPDAKTHKFEPGIFVETCFQQMQNNKKSSRSRSHQITSQLDIMTSLSPLSTCWLKNTFERNATPVIEQTENSDSEKENKIETVKKIVVEIKTEECQSDGEKTSDSESAVQDAIDLLSGGGCVRRHSSRKKERVQVKIKDKSPSPQRKPMSKVEETNVKNDQEKLKQLEKTPPSNSPVVETAKQNAPIVTQQNNPANIIQQNNSPIMSQQNSTPTMIQQNRIHEKNNSIVPQHKRSHSDVPQFIPNDATGLLETSFNHPPPLAQPRGMPPALVQQNMNRHPNNIPRMHGFIPPSNTMPPPPRQFHPLPSKPPANFSPSNLPPFFHHVNMNYPQTKYSPPGPKAYFPPQPNGPYIRPPGQMEQPPKESSFVPPDPRQQQPGHVQELSQYFANLTMKHENSNHQMGLMNSNYNDMDEWTREGNRDGTLPRQHLPQTGAMIKQAHLLHHNAQNNQDRFETMQRINQKQELPTSEEYKPSIDYQAGLGPIGSPIPLRNNNNPQQANCKTWPHYDQSQMPIDSNVEEDFNRYVADITKKTMQQRHMHEKSSAWNGSNAPSSFDIFSTPDLAKQIAANRLQEKNEQDSETRSRRESDATSENGQQYGTWPPPMWHIWANSETDNLVNWSKDMINARNESNQKN